MHYVREFAGWASGVIDRFERRWLAVSMVGAVQGDQIVPSIMLRQTALRSIRDG